MLEFHESFFQINDTVTRLLIDTTISNDISLTEDYFDFPLLGTPAIKKLEREAYLMVCSLRKLRRIKFFSFGRKNLSAKFDIRSLIEVVASIYSVFQLI